MNDKLYIHEFIDIIGHNRANYMHHMTANWSPKGQEERHQLCYGVWGVLGSTRRWPEVLNMWEEDGWEGLASSFKHETSGAGMQDPALAKWWARAAQFRSGGFDRILRPAPWTRTIEELCADGVTGATYAHEQLTVEPGKSGEFLEMVHQEGVDAYAAAGWELVGAFETAMSNDSECILLWAIPTWEQWGEGEKGLESSAWRSRVAGVARTFSRFLLVDSPLCPFRTHRQPAYSDQVDWDG
jgi:hypothetical protein